MVNPLVLSGSSLNTFMECPRAWQYQYLFRKDMPPSYKMALGIAAHEAVEAAYRYQATNGDLPPLDFWLAIFDQHWSSCTRNSRPKNHQPAESAEAHRKSGHSVIGYYARNIAPTIDVVAFEKPVAITINGHTWTGTIDLIDRMPDGRLRLRDHKFTSKKPEGTDRYKRPMIGYYLAAKHYFGEIAEVAIDYIVRGSPPTYTKLLIEPTEQDILDFATDIEEAVASINVGRFPPLGNQTLACRWCPYRKICPSARV